MTKRIAHSLVLMISISIFIGAKIDINDELHNEVLSGNIEKVKTLLNKGANVRYISNNMSVLSWPKLSAELVQLLIKKGADVNYVDPDRAFIPLIVAIEDKNIEVIKILLKNGADPNIKTVADMSALDKAQDSPEIVKILKAYGARRVKDKEVEEGRKRTDAEDKREDQQIRALCPEIIKSSKDVVFPIRDRDDNTLLWSCKGMARFSSIPEKVKYGLRCFGYNMATFESQYTAYIFVKEVTQIIVIVRKSRSEIFIRNFIEDPSIKFVKFRYLFQDTGAETVYLQWN